MDCWVLRPPDFDPSRKYPVIVQVHRATFGTGFHHEFQTLAGQGYVVFYINKRGALGYGQDFAVGNVRQYGGKDVDDVMIQPCP